MNARSLPTSPEGDWPEYFQAIATKPAHPLYAELDRFLEAPGTACELGCGTGQGVLHLAERGWRVSAVDVMEEPLKILASRIPSTSTDRITLLQTFIEEVEMPEASFDLVVAGFSLFFVSPDELPEVWTKITGSIRTGGLFMGQFLGADDSWAAQGYTGLSQDAVREMLGAFEPLHWDHVQRDGKAVHGYPKHWDVTHVIARKR